MSRRKEFSIPTAGQEEQEHLQATLGRAFHLSVVGFFVTPRSWGARVRLGEEQGGLWRNETGQGVVELVTVKRKSTKKEKPEEQVVDLNGGYQACQPTLEEGKPRVWSDNENAQRRAHMTLGCAEGVRPIQVTIDHH